MKIGEIEIVAYSQIVSKPQGLIEVRRRNRLVGMVKPLVTVFAEIEPDRRNSLALLESKEAPGPPKTSRAVPARFPRVLPSAGGPIVSIAAAEPSRPVSPEEVAAAIGNPGVLPQLALGRVRPYAPPNSWKTPFHQEYGGLATCGRPLAPRSSCADFPSVPSGLVRVRELQNEVVQVNLVGHVDTKIKVAETLREVLQRLVRECRHDALGDGHDQEAMTPAIEPHLASTLSRSRSICLDILVAPFQVVLRQQAKVETVLPRLHPPNKHGWCSANQAVRVPIFSPRGAIVEENLVALNQLW